MLDFGQMNPRANYSQKLFKTMKDQILVPTDFSSFAVIAADTAIALANRFDADIHFLNITFLDENLNMNIRKAMEKVKSEYAELGITMTSAFKSGALVDAVSNYVTEKKIDLIVMGSHGASGFNEMMIGSNTQKVVRNVHCPLLVVKQPIANVNFQNIVFASDFSSNEKVVFERFLDFIKGFSNPEIHLIIVNTGSFFSQPLILLHEGMTEFKKMAGDIPCTLHIESDFNVETGVDHFAHSIDADLIVISNYQRSKLKRLFVGSTVEALINHSEIPVLSLDF
jgi:nucleotide-binding universal stress UspA family protein